MVYEYLYRQIEDKKVRETIDFLLNREEAQGALFRVAFNRAADSGVTEDSKLDFNLNDPQKKSGFQPPGPNRLNSTELLRAARPLFDMAQPYQASSRALSFPLDSAPLCSSRFSSPYTARCRPAAAAPQNSPACASTRQHSRC